MESCAICGQVLAKSEAWLHCGNEDCPRFLRSIPRRPAGMDAVREAAIHRWAAGLPDVKASRDGLRFQ